MAKPFDFEVEPGLLFGDWLRRTLETQIHFEDEPFWLERVSQPAAKLQSGRPNDERLSVLIPWMRARTAWIAPGRHIYFGRGLLERLPSEESVAFVVAHELAHHDLRHLDRFRSWLSNLKDIPAGPTLASMLHLAINRAYSPEQEIEADKRAIDLCVEAGYEPSRCLDVFHVLETISLDLRDFDGVFGPTVSEVLDHEVITSGKRWLWQRIKGHPPIRDRTRTLQQHLRSKGFDI